MKPLQKGWNFGVGVFLIALGVFLLGLTYPFYSPLAAAFPLYIAGGIFIVLGAALVVEQLIGLYDRKKANSSS